MDTNAYQLRWQREAHRVLGEFLDAAAKSGLPAITWTIPVSGALVGDIDALASTPDAQRAAFYTWARQVGADVSPERTTRDGVVHLYGRFLLAGKPGTGGAIRAEIYPPFEGGEA